MSRIISIGFVTIALLCFLWATALLLERAHLLDQTHDSISTYDLNGAITFWNKAATQLYGWTNEQACGADAQELLKTAALISRNELHDVVRERGFWEGQLINYTRDGRAITINSRWSLLRDNLKRPRGFLETSNDVTVRVEFDHAVRRYSTIFETSMVSIVECDISEIRHRVAALGKSRPADLRAHLHRQPDFIREAIGLMRVVDVNDAGVRLFGVQTKGDLLGNMDQFWPIDSERIFGETMIAIAENRPMFEAETVLQTIDGEELDVVLTCARLVDVKKRNTIFLSLTDVTAFNRARSALQSAQADLARVTRLTSLGQLTASIAHEVNQPLSVILSNGQAGLRWLRRETPDIAAAIKSLEEVTSDAKRAGDIINGVQALARNEISEQIPVDLSEIVNESLLLMGAEIRKCGAELITHFVHPSPVVRVNRVQIQQVIINLATNSIQAMSQLQGPRQLRVSTSIESSAGVVTVADTGPGIDPAVRDRLFSPFTTTKAGGIGLGLSICATIVARYGGGITAGAHGDGASFAFRLPLEEA